MRVLVTGVTGFVGGHLAQHLIDCGDSVIGCARTGKWPDALRHLGDRVQLSPCDLGDFVAIRELLNCTEFDGIIHLAGLANPRACQHDPGHAERENVLATQHLLDAVRYSKQRPRILFVSTGYVYAPVPRSELPIGTAAPINPQHPYAATKWAAEQLCVRYTAEHGLTIVRVRTFNHVGPRQPPGYIVADWAQQIAAIEAGQAAPRLRVGNLDTRRDYSDVRDVVRAYRLLVHEPRAFPTGKSELYNLGSGTSWSGREMLEMLRELSPTQWEWEIDAQLVRPGEAEEIVVDAMPLRKLLGWKPAINFSTTLGDTLDSWRRSLKPAMSRTKE